MEGRVGVSMFEISLDKVSLAGSQGQCEEADSETDHLSVAHLPSAEDDVQLRNHLWASLIEGFIH